MAEKTCTCGHTESHHSETHECSGDRYCGCIEFKDKTKHHECYACGGDGYTCEPGPCTVCKGEGVCANSRAA